ncbi:MAG TPA: hypothetical protein ENL13_05150, partial [Thermoplasmatales archaeon]|nr:hypothetical protein [Thermoplasmatales archaeon]
MRGSRLFTRTVSCLTITLILFVAALQSTNAKENVFSNSMVDVVTIKIALYDAHDKYNIQQFKVAFNYGWRKGNRLYRFNLTTIDSDDVLGLGAKPLTNKNFDVFVVGANAKTYLYDGLNNQWKKRVKEFVANGGGYLGVCGGANAATLGFKHSDNLFHLWVNKGVIGLANVYINDDLLGEWQYLLKFGFDAKNRGSTTDFSPEFISVNTTIEKNSENIIFKGYNKVFLNIAYGGGPGMYPADKTDEKFGKIIPLLVYNEEPMRSKPLHYWLPTLKGGKILCNVTTNLFGKYAGVATTYNSKGRVVLYGPHPEYPLVPVNGTIHEYLGKGYLMRNTPFKQYVYNYLGRFLNLSSNIWVIRRSAAWAAHVPENDLPPFDETSVWLIKPSPHQNKMYFKDRFEIKENVLIKKLFKDVSAVVFGNPAVQVRTSLNIKKVEFYVDNNLLANCTKPDFIDHASYYTAKVDIGLQGKHTIKVKAYDKAGNVV